MLKAYLFGAGGGGSRLYDDIKEQYDIIGIVDNDKRKWGHSGETCCGGPQSIQGNSYG